MIAAGGGGKIITVSSIHGLGASHRNGMYSATKAAAAAGRGVAPADPVDLYFRKYGSIFGHFGNFF